MDKKQISKIGPYIKQYLEELKKIGISVESVILYGSYAKGIATESSDIDLIIVSKDLAKWPPIKRLQILSRATINIKAPLEVLGYTPAEIKAHTNNSIIWDEIVRTGKNIYKKAA